MIKIKAFSLIEMLVTLVIFSICILAVYGVMEANLRLINKLYSSGANETQAIILSKNIENIVKNSAAIEENGKGEIILHSFNNSDYFINISGNNCLIQEKRKNILWYEKDYRFDDAGELSVEILQKGKIYALRLKIKLNEMNIDRTILAGSIRNRGNYEKGT